MHSLLVRLCTSVAEIRSDPAQVDKILYAQQQLDQIKDIMQQNITLALERSESIDELDKKSIRLLEDSEKMWKDTKKLNRCCKYY